jgi:hypothetical protein
MAPRRQRSGLAANDQQLEFPQSLLALNRLQILMVAAMTHRSCMAWPAFALRPFCFCFFRGRL